MNKFSKFLYLLFILNLIKVHVGEVLELQTSNIIKASYAPSSYLLILENSLAGQASDASKPPFDGRCSLYTFALCDDPNIPVGAFYIMGGQHNFPFIYLPEAFQRIILRTDFLVNEINNVEDRERYYGKLTPFVKTTKQRFLRRDCSSILFVAA